MSREHALVRDELVLALVTNSHDRVGWRKRVLKAGVAAAGTAAEPRSVQTVHRPMHPLQRSATTFPDEDLPTDV